MHISDTAARLASPTWRVVVTGPAPGAWNMAVDEAILASMTDSSSLPTLRFYAWHPACLSLGYSQPFSDVNEIGISKNGWDVVRRITGGKAILHTDELTYSIIGRTAEPLFAGSILSSYRKIAHALLSGLHSLGVEASLNKDRILASSHLNAGPICFEMPSSYEITVGGKKILGSAQARRKTGIIQHGTLPLHGDLSRILDCIVEDNNTTKDSQIHRLMKRTTTLEKATGRVFSFDQVVEKMQDAFQFKLGIKIIASNLSKKELELADNLVIVKYGSESWTERNANN